MKGFDSLTIECFIAVTETGGFTSAAKKINRTQSAVSQQISKLENQIGKQLFNRNHDLSLTHEGEIFLNYAKQIAKLNREAIERFKNPGIQGKISFGLPEDFASVLLSEILTEFVSQYPRITLNVDCDLTVNLYEAFKKNQYDLVLLKMSKPIDFPNGVDIYSEKLQWVSNRHFMNDQNKPIPLVISPQPCVYRLRAIESLEKNSIKWRVAFSSHSYAGKIAAIRAGIGITVLPHNMIPNDLKVIQKNLLFPDLDDTHISLIKHDSKNSAVKCLESFILNKLK